MVIVVFAIIFALLGVSLEQGTFLLRDVQQKGREEAALQLAEGGIELACQQLLSNPDKFASEQNMTLETGAISVAITQIAPSGMLEIFSKGTLQKSEGRAAVQKAVRVRVSVNREQEGIVVHQWEEEL